MPNQRQPTKRIWHLADDRTGGEEVRCVGLHVHAEHVFWMKDKGIQNAFKVSSCLNLAG